MHCRRKLIKNCHYVNQKWQCRLIHLIAHRTNAVHKKVVKPRPYQAHRFLDDAYIYTRICMFLGVGMLEDHYAPPLDPGTMSPGRIVMIKMYYLKIIQVTSVLEKDIII